jgi:hypothetical protein
MTDGDFQVPAGYKLYKEGDAAILEKSYKLFNSLYDDPEHGATFKQAIKKVDPTVRIPEIDVAEPLLKPIREQQAAMAEENKKLREEIEKDRQERADNRDVMDLSQKLESAQRKHRLTPDGMTEVKKIMAERGIADPEVAATYVVANIERAAPVTGSNFGPTDANVFSMDGSSEDAKMKLLHNSPMKFLDAEVSDIMAEFENAA